MNEETNIENPGFAPGQVTGFDEASASTSVTTSPSTGESTNIVNPGMAPGMAPGFEEDPAPAVVTSGALIDYLLAWSVAAQDYVTGETVPLRFRFSRPDGMNVQIADADTVSVVAALPDGTVQSALTLLASTMTSAPYVDLAALYTFAGGAGLYTFTCQLIHDKQTLKARQRLIVN